MHWYSQGWRRWLGSAAALWAVAAPALAEDEPRPFLEPGISFLPATNAYIPALVGVALLAAITFAAIKNPHRSHLD